MQGFAQDLFNPTLRNSPSLVVTGEQIEAIRLVLNVTSSDSRFASKAFIAISAILLVGSSRTPVISSLSPSQAVLGSPSFTLHVLGSLFTSTSKIFWNGSEEPTTFVSDTELTTEVNMATAQVAIDIPVMVVDGTVYSNTMIFKLLAA